MIYIFNVQQTNTINAQVLNADYSTTKNVVNINIRQPQNLIPAPYVIRHWKSHWHPL